MQAQTPEVSADKGTTPAITSAAQLTQLLENVRCLHDISAELIAADVFSQLAEPAGERETIRAVFLRNGFTVKEGQTDLKPYVYAAAEELLSIARASWQRTQSAGVPEGWRDLLRRARRFVEDWDDDSQEFIDLCGEIDNALAAAPAQPAAHDQGEVQRLREALERATKLLSAAAGYATKMEPMPAKLLNAIDAELDASTRQQLKQEEWASNIDNVAAKKAKGASRNAR